MVHGTQTGSAEGDVLGTKSSEGLVYRVKDYQIHLKNTIFGL